MRCRWSKWLGVQSETAPADAPQRNLEFRLTANSSTERLAISPDRGILPTTPEKF